VGALVIRVLGPLEVLRDGREVVVSGLRRRALLVRLVVSANEVVPSGRLIEDLWDGRPPPGAAATLQSHVSKLRALLGSDRIRFSDGGYVLTLADGECDVGALNELAEAGRAERADDLETAAAWLEQWLGRWRGEALADVAGASWAAGDVARLEDLRAGAVERLLEVRLGLGDHRTVGGEAERAVSEFPLREGLWSALMLALYRSGRQSDALRAFTRLRTMLGEELGIEPSAELRALEEAILLQKPELDWRPAARVPDSAHKKEMPAGSRRPASSGSLGAFTHNLPVQVSSFLGRAEELVLGANLLAATRLLSVVGPGGVGKTRLAYELAEAQLQQFPGGVWVVELASEVDPQRIPALLLSGLGLRDEAARTATETIISYLADRQALVVLDNCEHVVDAAASVVAEMLGSCARLRVLATSRETLRVAGETVWQIGALDLPDTTEANLALVAAADAVALFCDRAAAARVGFALDIANVATVTTICSRLEGMPLAIELAAARVRTLPLTEIADRLEHSLDLLAKGPRHGDDRHSSLRATLTWSHDLLTPAEQVLFRRLAVFVGGFTLAAADSVCPGEGLRATKVLDALDGLVDKSLVHLSIDQAGQGRYRLLETVRAYAHERLVLVGELAEHLDRHARFYARLASDCAAKGATGGACDRLEADHPNILAALQHVAGADLAIEHGRLVLDLSLFWDLRGYWRLGEGELRAYLSRADRDGMQSAACLRRLGLVATRMGDYPQARAGYGVALTAARQVGDRWEESMSLGGLGHVAWYVADYADSGANYGEALAIARELGDPALEAKWLGNLALVAESLGNYAEASSRFETALIIARQTGDRHAEASMLGQMGVLASSVGDYQEALARYEEALVIFREIGDRYLEAGYLGNLGRISLRFGDDRAARSRFEEALTLSHALGGRQSEGYWIGSLGEVACQVGDWQEARSRCEEALAIAREIGDRRSQQRWLDDLGGIECQLGQHAAARTRYQEALTMARELGKPDDPLLEGCASLLVALERYEEATEVLGAGGAITAQTHRGRSIAEQSQYDASLAACRTHLAEQIFELSYERGLASDWARASARALELLAQT
jgi:predicted ATPase/DNA-binding SARP family transcriptional activator